MAHGYADIAMQRYRAGLLNILIFKKLAGVWWAGEVVNHIWIYGSKVAEGSSAFQRRSCCFWCWLTLTFKVKFNFKIKFTPFWARPHNNSSSVQTRTTKFGPQEKNTLVKIPIVLGVGWAWQVKLNLVSKSCLFASFFVIFDIFVRHLKTEFVELFHIPHGWAHMLIPLCMLKGLLHGPWTSLG